MEHLARPKTAIQDDVDTVRYVSKSYDGGPFLTYPLRIGKPYMLPSKETPHFWYWQYEKLHPTPNREMESLCQTWLFFGLINEILGEFCQADDFVRKRDDEVDNQIITTSKLPDLIKKWVQQVHSGKVTQTYDHVAHCLQLAHSTLKAVGPTFDLVIMFSIASVAEMFEFAATEAFHIMDLKRDNQCPVIWCALFQTSRWIPSMKAKGWCPSVIYQLCENALSVHSMYFFLCMPREDSPGRHNKCDRKRCVAYQNYLERYQTKHVRDNCDCSELVVDGTVTDAVLQKGALPLLRIIPGKNVSDVAVEVHASEASSRYVALSHVWADGLGNPAANALPQCQLLFLNEVCQRISCKVRNDENRGELYFWCDTLCCPVVPQAAKNRALSRMKETYEKATCVLVLDSSIRIYDSFGMSPEEICIIIFASGWMRRLWTLQEAVIPAEKGRLWFHFRDRDINLRPVWDRVLEIANEDVGRRGITKEIITRLRGIMTLFRRSRLDRNDTGTDLTLIDTALQGRSVSVTTDEPLLIANLLDLKSNLILDGPPETRIHRLWTLMPKIPDGIPRSIIFRLVPKLKAPGFRWAPVSMLFRDETDDMLLSTPDTESHGLPTPRGLLVTLPGYKVSWPHRPSGLPTNPWGIISDDSILYMRDELGVWYLLHQRRSAMRPSDGDFLSLDPLAGLVRGTLDLSIIYLETKFTPNWNMAPLLDSRPALMVTPIDEENGVIYVNSYIHLHIGRMEDGNQGLYEAAYESAKLLSQTDMAKRLADFEEDAVKMENAAYKAVFELLEPEMHRIARLPENKVALAVSKQLLGTDSSMLLAGLIGMCFSGHYAIVQRTDELQKWCVD